MFSAGMNAAGAEPLPVLYADDFQKGMDRWAPLGDEPSFAVVDVVGPAGTPTKALRALGNSKYKPPFRSPPNVALLKDLVVGDLELTADVQSTNSGAGPHRDMCVAFGYQSPTQFYYVHLGAEPDPHACQIFIVDDAPRKAMTAKTSGGTPWTDGWHRVKVVRRLADGWIGVYFDDMETPHLEVHDATFGPGQVGLGTFDDHGHWDNVEVRGVQVEPAS
ncbi:MAG TPA: hypothetical protein PKC18_15290 [Lacipirellulaceae bacterium]|nr:hypothetical protein [Lacipirellulaceae bacterium]